MTQNEWLAIAPFLIVAGLALLVVVVDLIWPKRPTIVTGAAVVGLVAAMVVTVAAGTGAVPELKATTLIQGTGTAVQSGQTINVNYVGVTYADGKAMVTHGWVVIRDIE